jgi:hypothetical protein
MILFKKKQSKIPKRRAAEHVVNNTPITNIFKRNRTLTRTTPANLKAPYTKINIDSPRTRMRNLSIRRRKITGVFMATLFFITLIWILVSNLITAVVVNVADLTISKPIEQTRYQKVIQDYLDNNPTNRFTFTLSQTSLLSYISNKLPEVSDIKFGSMDGIGRATFTITMRSPVAGWMIDNKQYYVDSKGIPFEENYFSAPVVQIVDNSGVSLHTSTSAIASHRFLSFIGRVVYLARSYGYTVIQAALPNNTTRELEIKLKEGGFTIKLSTDRPAGEQVEDMSAAIRYFTNRQLSSQYIDVRVSGKAFYK